MNTRILSVLLLLFLGLSFSSCSKDDKTAGYDAGKSKGADFLKAASDFKNGDVLARGTAALTLYDCYTAYKKNSGDSEWKKGFLSAATTSDEQSEKLESLLNETFSDKFTLATEIVKLLFGSE